MKVVNETTWHKQKHMKGKKTGGGSKGKIKNNSFKIKLTLRAQLKAIHMMPKKQRRGMKKKFFLGFIKGTH